MKEETYHIWINITVSTSTYKYEADCGAVETSIALPARLVPGLDLGNFVELLVKEAVGQHELKKSEQTDAIQAED